MSDPRLFNNDLRLFLSVSDGFVKLHWEEDGRDCWTAITSVSQLDELLVGLADGTGHTPGDLVVMLSSTMDFPEEYTEDEEVLGLVRKITRCLSDGRA